MKICFLVSGNGGNMKFIFLAQKYQIIQNIELSVIADRACGAVKFAKKESIPYKVISYTKKKNSELKYELLNNSPDLIITNWHKIIDEDLVDEYRGKMINLHYSLLPAFKGLIGIKPILEAYESGCKYLGVTTHYVDFEVDSGRQLCQSVIKNNSSLDKTIETCFRKGCIILLNSIVLLTEEKIIDSKKNIEYCGYSPSLLFDPSVFHESFWKELKQI